MLHVQPVSFMGWIEVVLDMVLLDFYYNIKLI